MDKGINIATKRDIGLKKPTKEGNMKKVWMAMLVAVIAGIGLVPAVVQGGGPYERSALQERHIIVSDDPYPEIIPCYTAKPCETAHHRVSHTERYDGVGGSPCREKNIVSAPCPKPRKSERRCVYPCPDPCLREVERLTTEIQKLERELGAARERERTAATDLLDLERENAILRERERANDVRDNEYREWYTEFKKWQAKSK